MFVDCPFFDVRWFQACRKTHFYIFNCQFQNHREKRRRLNIPKVAFLVEQSALAEQQGKVCKEFLACKTKVITGEKQRTESLQNLSCWIQKCVNVLYSYSKVIGKKILVRTTKDEGI